MSPLIMRRCNHSVGVTICLIRPAHLRPAVASSLISKLRLSTPSPNPFTLTSRTTAVSRVTAVRRSRHLPPLRWSRASLVCDCDCANSSACVPTLSRFVQASVLHSRRIRQVHSTLGLHLSVGFSDHLRSLWFSTSTLRGCRHRPAADDGPVGSCHPHSLAPPHLMTGVLLDRVGINGVVYEQALKGIAAASQGLFVQARIQLAQRVG